MEAQGYVEVSLLQFIGQNGHNDMRLDLIYLSLC